MNSATTSRPRDRCEEDLVAAAAEPQRPSDAVRGEDGSRLALIEPGGGHRARQRLECPRLVPRVRGQGEDRLGVDGHPGLGTGAGVGGKQLVVVEDDPVVNPDHRPVPHRVIVGGDRRMALRVVADMHENLGRVFRNGDPLEQMPRRRPLLGHDRIAIRRPPIGVTDCIRAAVGDPGQERLRGKRAVDPAPRREAISGDSAHLSWRCLSPYRYGFPATVGQVS